MCIHEVLRKFVSKNKTNHPISSINLPLATANKAIHCIKRGGGGWGLVKNQREHHIILTKYDAVHPAVVSGKMSSSGMLTILIKRKRKRSDSVP